jgi:hypothetical protein
MTARIDSRSTSNVKHIFTHGEAAAVARGEEQKSASNEWEEAGGRGGGEAKSE